MSKWSKGEGYLVLWDEREGSRPEVWRWDEELIVGVDKFLAKANGCLVVSDERSGLR